MILNSSLQLWIRTLILEEENKMEVKIFVEGYCDKRLIEDYISHLKLQKGFEVIYTGGKDKIKTQIPTIKKFNDQEHKVAVIFDSDKNFKNRLADLEKLKNENEIIFDIFLFPNHKDAGTIEDLLLNIYNPIYQPVFDCLDAYEKCLTKNGQYKVPIKKGKIYGFLDAVLPIEEEDKVKDNKREFIGNDYWLLDNAYLKPLEEFLLKYKVEL